MSGNSDTKHLSLQSHAGATDGFMSFTQEEIEQSIPERFEEIVRRYPDRIAIKMQNRSLTYNALNQATNRIAHSILEKRGPRSEPIALLFDHGIDIISSILGVLKAGKYYVSLDPNVAEERCAHILADSSATLIITNDSYLPLAQKLAGLTSILLNIDTLAARHASENLGLTVSPNAIAYLNYTSGSTGRPKGVIDIHRNILHSVIVHKNVFRTCPQDKLSLIHSFSFAAVNSNLFQSLLSGAALSLFNVKAQGLIPFRRWLIEEQITLCHLPTGLFRELAALHSGRQEFADLRLLQLSGSSITKRDFELYRQMFSMRTRLGLMMGSTETKILCVAVVDHDFEFPDNGSPVGYPVSGKQIYLLDDDGREVRRGETGEIVVQSSYLTLGYWNRSSLNDANFALTPKRGEERRYFSGDLGRMLPDGFLIHVGRKDLMVKIRGYRVNLTEVEGALFQHSQVKDAGVAAWDREPGEKYLVGYVVPRRESMINVSELNEFLRTKLPEYMIPAAFVLLESLPLTNGKLDRSALQRPGNQRPDLRTAYVPPRNNIERSLSRIWEGVLVTEKVGIHDNFFDLGGHSLAAARIISGVIKQFQLELPIKALFESPTVAEMAAVITTHQGKQLTDGELARVLGELESLSDEEAQRLLAEETTSSDSGPRHE